MFKVVLQREMI